MSCNALRWRASASSSIVGSSGHSVIVAHCRFLVLIKNRAAVFVGRPVVIVTALRGYVDFFVDFLPVAGFAVEGFLPSGFGGWLPFDMAHTPF